MKFQEQLLPIYWYIVVVIIGETQVLKVKKLNVTIQSKKQVLIRKTDTISLVPNKHLSPLLVLVGWGGD